MCETCVDDHATVSLVLVMPEDRALAMLTEFRDKKMAGEPATIPVNVMHVAMMGTDGKLPEPIDGQEQRLRQATTGSSGRIWWPKGLLLIALLATYGVVVVFAPRPVLLTLVWITILWLGFRVGQLIRWRR